MSAPNREMITLAREWREYTQSDLASAAGITQGSISKIENGQIVATDETIEKIAAALAFPREFFFQELRVSELPQSLFRRRLTDVSQKTLKASRARWAVMLRGLSVLLEAVEFPECRVQQYDLARLGIGPAEAARRLRREWNVPMGPIQNVTALVEQMGVLVVPFDFGSERIDGMSVYDRSLGLPPVIFVNNNVPGDRQRFTTLHELCHIACHTHLVGENDADIEHEADVFASEFLLPEEQIRGHLSGIDLAALQGLKVHWKASMASLLMKADSIGAVSVGRRNMLWKQISKRGWRTQEPSPVPREGAGLLASLVRLHEQQLGYSPEELCAVLCHVNKDDLQALYPVARAAGLRLI